MSTQYYTGSSLDGFIADPDTSLDWLVTRDIDPVGPMAYDGFFASVGAMAMGANTYRWLLANDLEDGAPVWRYQVPCWVFTHSDLPDLGGDVRFVNGSVATVHAHMVAVAGGRNVWVVGGGDLAGQFADEGLLDEVWVQFAPVCLGGGAPLLPRNLELRLLEVERNRDFACVRYRVGGESVTPGR